MSEQIKSFLTSVDTLSIVVTEERQFYKDYKKCDIYNSCVDEAFQKIWLKTPRVKTLSSAVFRDSANRDIRVAVALTGEGMRFVETVKKIEKLISSKLKKKIRSTIKKMSDYTGVMTLKTPVQDNRFTFRCFGPKNVKLDFREVERDEKMTAFIELTDVWIKDDEIGLNWTVLQTKVYQTFDFEKCLFDDEEPVPEEKPVVIPERPRIQIPLNPLQALKPVAKREESVEKPRPPIMGFIPTKEALLDMRNKLKKSVPEEQISEEEQHVDPIDIEETVLEAELEGDEIEEMMKRTDKQYSSLIEKSSLF